MNERINSHDLIALGYKKSQALGVALQLNKKRWGYTREQLLQHFKAVLINPMDYQNVPIFKPLAEALLHANRSEKEAILLHPEPNDYRIYGAENIETGARIQMDMAMKLPVTVAGALMPDAHQGYGLPIGGVLATDHAVIPY